MTEAEYQAGLAKLTSLETELAANRQAVQSSIAAARKQNLATSALRDQGEAIEGEIRKVKPDLEAYVAAVNAERKRIANEQAAKVAAENAKREAEEKAAKAKEASELEVAKARIAELEAAAAKG